MNGYEVVARQLQKLGVRIVFGLVGDDVAQLAECLVALDVRYIATRHENQAVAMADVYARTSGQPGVVILAGGPGVSNGLTAINTAHHAGSSVLVVTGAGSAIPKPFALSGVCSELGVAHLSCRAPETLAADARRAFDMCTRGQTVVCSFEVHALEAACATTNQDLTARPISAEPTELPSPSRPDVGQIADICELLEDDVAARRPIILAGLGAVKSNAGQALRQLGDLVGAVLYTTLKATGLFAEDDFAVGVMGTYSSGIATELAMRADTLLVFGASLNRFTTYDGALTSRAIIVQVDTDDDAFGRHVDVEAELRVHADVRLTAEALVEELQARDVRRTGYRTDEVGKRIRDRSAAAEIVELHADGLVDPRLLSVRLDQMLPRERTLVYDGGRHQNYVIPHLRIDDPRRFIQMSSAGSIGLAIGGAVGAALGDPQRLAVACVGDASFLMALNDVETAARERVRLVILVSNDDALGAEVRFLELRDSSTRVAEAPTPDLAAVATALGATAISVRSLTDLDALPNALAAANGPVVLDCRIDARAPSSSIDFLFSRGRSDLPAGSQASR